MAKQKKVDIWMPLYVSDYLSDTMHLNTEQHGAYMLLLMAAWKLGGRIANNAEQLQAITRMQPARWKVAEPILRPFFYVTDEFWISNRVVEELAKAKKNSEIRTKSGAIGAAKRWQTKAKPIANAMANAIANEMADELGDE